MNNYLRIIAGLLPKWMKKNVNKRYVAVYLRVFLSAFFFLMAGVLLQILVILSNQYQVVREDYDKKQKEYKYWSSVASQYPTVPDILYNAGLSAFAIGKKEEARDFVGKALRMDPLFSEARELDKLIK